MKSKRVAIKQVPDNKTFQEKLNSMLEYIADHPIELPAFSGINKKLFDEALKAKLNENNPTTNR